MNTENGYSIEEDEFLFLFNDLTAARWVFNINPDVSDQQLVNDFMEIHQVFLTRLSRKDRGIFRKVTLKNLANVVRGWIYLYQRTLVLLQRQYPRSPNSRDLVIGRVNWSEQLNISASGLLMINHSSRYAEYWAERAIKTSNGYLSLESRLSFIGSYIYNEYAKMIRQGRLLVLDSFSNGVTSYDMLLFMEETGCTPDLFLSEISKLGWRLEVGNEKDISRLFQLYTEFNG
ncbi:hypothetical protein AB6C74_06250 [Vibrio splendidus]